MSKNGVEVWMEGQQQLFVNMQRRMDGCTEAARRGLFKAALKIVNDAKINLRNNNSIAFGNLRKSGRAQAVKGDPDAFDAGFFWPYAAYVEYGRGPTKVKKGDGVLTLKESLKAWVRKKFGIVKAEAVERLARNIARKIHKRGTKPRPYLGPAVEANKNAVSKYIAAEVRKETRKDGK